ncbi:FKBP-type peptidyl-prolyl cis-trans isomerase SlyD [Methanomicrobium sp. W14]|uniref:FKBP-type peptidyl-prolyl cis-trans isomerase n=1 Tax=Methanomicrobium sp. W14 TaxID=2817839 RepID=UPI001AE9B1C0|nr:peptidylprolyl isomerase [Methanomicrobium sp. W14]MBP2132996.1 FKBP-type peptidyl-prolyl cis-trans isomerase SlyD [Methanomicrobium sp. W14]
MEIKEGDFVRLNYTGSVDGNIFDTTSEELAKENDAFSEGKDYEPIVIRIGGNHVIPGLDEDLAGKEAGKEYEVTIPPEKAYGQRDNTLVKSLPTKEFKEKPTVGMRVSSEGHQGVVVNVIGKRAVVDFNHMLAGKTLDYKYTVEGVVEDAVEKAKALFKLFANRDFEMELNDGVLTVSLPAGITYDQRWMMGKGMAVYQAFEYVDGIEEIVLKETFKKPEKKEPEPVENAEEN